MVVVSLYWSLVPRQHMSQGTHCWIKQIMPQWRQHLPRRSARMPLSAMPILQFLHFAKCAIVKLPTSNINIPTSWFDMQLDMYFDLNDEIYAMTVLLRSATAVVFCFGLRWGQVFLLSFRALRTVHSDASLCHALETVSQQPRRLRKTGSERAKSTAVFVSTYRSHLPMYFDPLYSIVMYSASWWFLHFNGSEQISSPVICAVKVEIFSSHFHIFP